MSKSIDTSKIPLEITATLGKTRMTNEQLKSLHVQSVVELEKLAGEPMELYANGVLVARGEAIVVNEKFGIRINEIVKGS